MEAYRKIFIYTEWYQCTYSTKCTNKIIVPESPDLRWSRNLASLRTGEIRSSMVTIKKKNISRHTN
jgi:hypothetical protein